MRETGRQTTDCRSTAFSQATIWRVLGLIALLVFATGMIMAGTATAAAPDCTTVSHDGNGTQASPYEVGYPCRVAVCRR
ncbi:MAG: hypothetical protein U5K37_08455 [Natrialbaceae archaeon]|nr:hypothetical protein [Natrialbaceae archaeon]